MPIHRRPLGDNEFVFTDIREYGNATHQRLKSELEAVHVIPSATGTVRALQKILYRAIKIVENRNDAFLGAATFAIIRDWATLIEHVARANANVRLRLNEVTEAIRYSVEQIPVTSHLIAHGFTEDEIEEILVTVLTMPAGRSQDWTLASRGIDADDLKTNDSWFDPRTPDTQAFGDPLSRLTAKTFSPFDGQAVVCLCTLILDPTKWYFAFPEGMQGNIMNQGVGSQYAAAFEALKAFCQERASASFMQRLPYALWQFDNISAFLQIPHIPGELRRLIEDVKTFLSERAYSLEDDTLTGYKAWLTRSGWNPSRVIEKTFVKESEVFTPQDFKNLQPREGLPALTNSALGKLSDDYEKLFVDLKSNSREVLLDRTMIPKVIATFETLLSDLYQEAMAIDLKVLSAEQTGMISSLRMPSTPEPAVSARLFEGISDSLFPDSRMDFSGTRIINATTAEHLAENLRREVHSSEILEQNIQQYELPFQICAQVQDHLDLNLGHRRMPGTPMPSEISPGPRRPYPNPNTDDPLGQLEQIFSSCVPMPAEQFVRSFAVGNRVRAEIDALSGLLLFATQEGDEYEVLKGFVKPWGFTYEQAWANLTEQEDEIRLSPQLVVRPLARYPAITGGFRHYIAGPGRLGTAPFTSPDKLVDIQSKTYTVQSWLTHLTLEPRHARINAPDRSYTLASSRGFNAPVFGSIPSSAVDQVDPYLTKREWIGITDNPAVIWYVIPGLTEAMEEPDLGEEAGLTTDEAADEAAKKLLLTLEKDDDKKDEEAKAHSDASALTTQIMEKANENETEA